MIGRILFEHMSRALYYGSKSPVIISNDLRTLDMCSNARRGNMVNFLSHLVIDHVIKNGIYITVFDLISGLSAYVFLGPKIALISEPPPSFFFFFLALKYFVCVYPGCKTLLPKIVACEGPLIMMTGSLKKKDLIFFFFF